MKETTSIPSSDELDAFYAVGRMLYERGDYERAADVFRFVALLAPSRSDVWWALGACHEQVAQLEMAAALYDFGFQAGGQPVDLGLLTARAHARAGDLVRAREVVRELRACALGSDQRTCLAAVVSELGGAP